MDDVTAGPARSSRVGRVALPERVRSPWFELGRRLFAAVAILVITVLLVYFDREGYRDGNDPTNQISLLDAFYYTTVTLSTTGYGDITPVSDGARLVNAFIITPARIAFLVLLESLSPVERAAITLAGCIQQLRDIAAVGHPCSPKQWPGL